MSREPTQSNLPSVPSDFPPLPLRQTFQPTPLVLSCSFPPQIFRNDPCNLILIALRIKVSRKSESFFFFFLSKTGLFPQRLFPLRFSAKMRNELLVIADINGTLFLCWRIKEEVGAYIIRSTIPSVELLKAKLALIYKRAEPPKFNGGLKGVAG